MFQRRRTQQATALVAAGLAALSTAAASQAAVTPLSSQVTSFSRIGEAEVTKPDSQGTTLDPLKADLDESGGGLTFDINVDATWLDADTGTVDIFYRRLDPTGFDGVFSGDGRFFYSFSVDSPVTVAVDYEATGSTDSTSFSGAARWWGMQGFNIDLGGQSTLLNFSNSFGLPNASSPQTFDGVAVFSISAGQHTLELGVTGGGVGNFPGDRAMTGTFSFQIGDEMTPVPLPAATWLLGGALALLGPLGLRRRREA